VVGLRHLAASVVLAPVGCTLLFAPPAETGTDGGGDGDAAIADSGPGSADADPDCPFQQGEVLGIDPCALELTPGSLEDVPEFSGGVLDTGRIDGPPLLVALEELDIDDVASLAIVGRRPVALISFGAINIAGELIIEPEPGDPACSLSPNGPDTDGDAGGGAGGSFATRGGAGNIASCENCMASMQAADPVAQPVALRRGCAGGRGGSDTTLPKAASGLGGGAVLLYAADHISIGGRLIANGGGGGGGAPLSGGSGLVLGGGGGGGSGGLVVLVAPAVVIPAGGCVSASGGGGGGGAGMTNSGEDGTGGADAGCGGGGGGLAGDAGTGLGGAGASGGSGMAGAYMSTSPGGAGGGGGGTGFILSKGELDLSGSSSPPLISL
jgi:hypothetical protein